MMKVTNEMAIDCAEFLSFANALKKATELKMAERLTMSEWNGVFSYALTMWTLADSANGFRMAKIAREAAQ